MADVGRSRRTRFTMTRQEARVIHYALRAVPQNGSEEFPLYKSEQIRPFSGIGSGQRSGGCSKAPAEHSGKRRGLQTLWIAMSAVVSKVGTTGRRYGRCGYTG